MKKIYLLACLLAPILSPVTWAGEAEDKGLAIAKEADHRNQGYGDNVTELTMTLIDADPQANADGKGKGCESQPERIGQAGANDGENRNALDEGGAKIQMQHHPYIFEELHSNGLIKAQLMTQALNILRAGALRGQKQCGITRQAHDDKHNHHHAKEGNQGRYRAMDQEARHHIRAPEVRSIKIAPDIRLI